jgi:carboxypeptidase D
MFVVWLADTHRRVDQPIGTGFSTGTPYATSQEETAASFLQWFRNWQDEFGIRNYKIYVTGESYAGRYVPYIAGGMVDANSTEYYDLNGKNTPQCRWPFWSLTKGILVYDPCIGEFNTVQSEIPAYPFVEENWNLFGFNASFMSQLKGLHEKCGYAEWIEKYLVFPPSGVQPPTYFNFSDPVNATCDVYDMIYNEAYATNPCFNTYAVVSKQ